MRQRIGNSFIQTRTYWLFFPGVVSLVPYFALAMERPTRAGILRHEFSFAIAFPLFVLSVLLSQNLPKSEHRKAVKIILLFAVLFRAMVVFTEPPRTTDPYRYVWEGKMTNHGINPFLYPPNHPSLVQYRDQTYKEINNKGVPSVYPATSQMLFALVYRLKPDSIIAFKVLFALIDLGTIAAIIGLLASLGLPIVWCILYAWHPLVITELSLNGHQDSIGIFFLMLSFLFFVRKRPLGCGMFLALSAMAKGYAVLACPFFLLRFLRSEGSAARQRARAYRYAFSFAVAFLVTGAIVAAPFVFNGGMWGEGPRQYLEYWEGNAGIYFVLNKVLKPLDQPVVNLLQSFGVTPATRLGESEGSFSPLAKGTCALILSVTFLLALRNFPEDARSVCGRVFISLAAFFMLSPTLYPWYLCWTIPFLCLFMSWSWLALTGLIVMDYLYHWYGEYLAWIRFGQYLPLWIGLLLEWWGRREGRA